MDETNPKVRRCEGMEYDNTPYICAECVHLDLERQQSDYGGETIFLPL